MRLFIHLLTAMYISGLFMALNKKIEECGDGVPYIGIFSRFILGPLCVGLACFLLGLDGEALKAAIIQVLFRSNTYSL